MKISPDWGIFKPIRFSKNVLFPAPVCPKSATLSPGCKLREISRRIGAKCDLAEAYFQLALTYQKMGEAENSQPNFDEAIRLFREMEAPKQVAKVRQAMSGESVIN